MIFFPPSASLPPVIISSPEYHYSRHLCTSAPALDTSPNTGPTSPAPLRLSTRMSHQINQ